MKTCPQPPPRTPAAGTGCPRFSRPWQRLAALLCLALLLPLTAGAQTAPTVVIDAAIPAEDNNSQPDQDGDYPAYVIIRNSSTTTVNIAGWGLSDVSSTPRKWLFPAPAGAGLPLAAGQSLIVFASAKNRTTPPYATNFLLPCGSTAYLSNGQGVIVSTKQVSGRNCRPCLPLINKGSIVSWTVPNASTPPATTWTSLEFNDGQWSRGLGCLGYETDGIAQSMVLYSTFDKADVSTTARTIADISGPAVLHTGTWPLAGVADVFIPEPGGQIEDQVRFNGKTASLVQYAHNTELDPEADDMTFAIWVNPDRPDLGGGEVIFRKGLTTTQTQGYMLQRLRDLDAGFGAITTTGTPIAIPFKTFVPGRQWTHLAVVIRNKDGEIRTYADGRLTNVEAFPAGARIRQLDLPLQLASATQSVGAFQGAMDDFIIWRRGLSDAEIEQVHEAGFRGQRVPVAGGGGSSLYGPLIDTNVGASMYGINPGIYMRTPFTVANPAAVRTLRLRLNDDDGCIVYLNGTEVVRRNASVPYPPEFNSTAEKDRADPDALAADTVDLTPFIGRLRTGANVLAIHAMNATATDQRFLICQELCYEEQLPADCYCTTNDQLFWIAFPTNFPEEPGNPLALRLCITGASGTTGTVAVPGLGFSQNFSLPATGATTVTIPSTAAIERSNRVENKGIRITASGRVAVYARTRIDFSTDSFLCVPVACLGTEYLTLGWRNTISGVPDLNGSQFAIVATADATQVTVTPSVTVGTFAAGVPYSFTLNEGQTYLLRSTANSPADLSGTEIKASKPVGVFAGHRCANVAGSQFFCDTVVEQMLPVTSWSTEACTAPLFTRTGGDTIRVMSSRNGTQVSRGGVVVATVDRGKIHEFTSNAGEAITATQPILVAQYARSSDADGVVNADPFQLNAQPTRSWLNGYRFCTPPAAEFSGHYCNVIGRTAELSGLTIAPAAAAVTAITPIAGSPYAWRTYQLAAGTSYTFVGRQFGLAVYGWGQYDSHGHSGGMGFDDFQPPVFGQCPDSMTIFCTVTPNGCFATVPDYATLFGVTDNCCAPGSTVVTQDPRPGSVLPEGNHQVTITAIDCNQNRTTCTFTLVVRKNPQQQAFPNDYGNPATEATIWGWDADPDKDRLTNRMEYALGTDPDKPNRLSDVVRIRRNRRGDQGDRLEITYRRRRDDPSIDYIPQGSNGLEGWVESVGHLDNVEVVPDPDPLFDSVTESSIDSEGSERYFLRLKIRQN